MFLTDEQIELMTGINREEHRPSTLRRWLLDHGFAEDVDFFQRKDGWYSVLHPHQRAVVQESRPRVRRRA